jgi:AraC family transcriptional regulator
MSSHSEIVLKETRPEINAFVAVKGPYTQIADCFSRLYGWIGQKGFVPAGPPSGVYFNAPTQVPQDGLLWELRSPIAGNVQEMGPDGAGLGIKRSEAGLVASTEHHGPYETVGETYGVLGSWIAENGYEIAGPVEEVYITDPMEVKPEELTTEIRFPVKKARG